MFRALVPFMSAVAVGCAGTQQKVNQTPPDMPSAVARITVDPLPPEILNPSQLQSAFYRDEKEENTDENQNRLSTSSEKVSLVSSETINEDAFAIPNIPPLPDENFEVSQNGLGLEDVVNSVYRSYPLLDAAIYSREVASGERLQTLGEFDRKFKSATENGPMGYYKTYRQNIGLVQPLYQGGEVFAGYKIGRGNFQPWYKERQTNQGGEFKAGFSVPLARNRDIDARRAALWRATFGVDAVEPDIQAQLIGFVQEGTYAYWDWVAAGAKLVIADQILKLAEARTDRIRSQVENGFLDPPELTDNLRLIAERSGKRAFAERKLQQAAVKLSLYYRDANGDPLIPGPDQVPVFPELMEIESERIESDARLALERRPEIYALNLLQHQLDIDHSEAMNDSLPAVDLVMAAAQDIGYRTDPKNDKGPFELDAMLYVDVPLQRRKARGKIQSVSGKISQLNAKRKLTEEKIVAEVESVYAGLIGAYKQAKQAEQAVGYAEDLARRERRNFEEGLSDLLKVTLREQYAVESAEKTVDAKLLYFKEQADYRAALAEDRLPASQGE